jgi:GTP pyrophosphokinase
MVRLQDIIDEMRSHDSNAGVDTIKKAYVFTAKVHQGQVRRSGEPYLVHPLGVANIIAKLNLDEASIVAGMLHDTLEDTLTTPEEIEELFGNTVRFLVEGVTKLAKVSFSSGEARQAENVRKMLVAMSEDIRVILVKLADRLHNMRTLEYMDEEKIQAISQETLDIYAPLANRLGIQWVRTELEDIAFSWLYPEQYRTIDEKLQRVRTERETYTKEVISFLSSAAKENEIEVTVTGRIKHHYSIFKKIKQKSVDFEQVYDILAFRIITNDIGDCYRVLGLIHSLWKPVSGRFKDYIAMPKINRYQSLHTTVLGIEGERVEIQIRTQAMHRIAEEGVAAHWAYKEGTGNTQDSKNLSQFAWLRELLEQQKDVKDPSEFLESVRVDLFSDEVFVFTPQGEVKAMPRGATALDFAYSIHSEVGYHCSGAKVNGKIAPLRQKLKNGDTVEILTNQKQMPSKDWLSFVKTSRARNRIRSVVRAEQRKRSKEIGREALERECKRKGISLNKTWRSGKVAKVAEMFGYKNPDEMLVALGYGKLGCSKIVEEFLPPEKRKQDKAAEDPSPSKIANLFSKSSKRGKTGILVQGIDDVLVRFGKCCSPIPGDELVGVITRGRGVTVHTRKCNRVLDSDPDRQIDVHWDVNQSIIRTVNIRVYCEDQPGVLASISSVLSEGEININQLNVKSDDAKRAICNFKLGIKNLTQLQRVLSKLIKTKGVISADRL